MLSKDPKSVFQWEAGKGLEHACYACPMKANNPKAKDHCFGVHCVPCFRYHQTMHAVGASHNCSACINMDEVHVTRHRKIAELLAEYKLPDNEDDEFGPSTKRKKTRLSEISINIPPTPTPIRQANIEPEHPLGHEEAPDQDQDAEEDLDIDTTSTSNSSETNTFPRPSKAELRSAKKLARTQKSQSKALHNQLRHVVSVKNSDIEHVRLILHGSAQDADSGLGHPLATDKEVQEVIERNRSFVVGQKEHRKMLLESISRRREQEKGVGTPAKRAAKVKKLRFVVRTGESKSERMKERLAVGADDELERVVEAVLIKLGVGVGDGDGSPSARSKAKTDVVEKLRAAIKDDLEKHENEQRETCVRAGGFWRYVGRNVFDRMTEIARTYDWKTGEVLKEDDG